jgi:hypothetical protein
MYDYFVDKRFPTTVHGSGEYGKFIPGCVGVYQNEDSSVFH